MQTEKLIELLAAQGPQKRRMHPNKAAIGMLAFMFVYYGVALFITGLRPDLVARFQQPLYLAEILLAGLSGLAALCAASWLALPDVGQRPGIRFLPFIPFAALAGLHLYSMSPLSWQALGACAKLELYMPALRLLAYGVLPAAILFVAIEKAAPIRCCWAGSMAALSVACFGYIFLRMTEPVDDPARVAMWYLMPVVLMAMIGMMAGGLTLKRGWR